MAENFFTRKQFHSLIIIARIVIEKKPTRCDKKRQEMQKGRDKVELEKIHYNSRNYCSNDLAIFYAGNSC